jgi:DNA modification methylase
MSKLHDKQELFDELGKSRGFYSKLNRLNDLTGKEWLFWTRSVISKVYPPNLQHALRSIHGGQKPPELCADLIRIFTKKGQRVLDPFMGVGGVLLGAALASRSATGIELNGKWIEIYKKVCDLEGLKQMEVIGGDAKDVLVSFKKRRFDLVFTDVPYWKMDRAPRSMGKYKKYGEQSRLKKLSKLSAFNEITYSSKAEWLKEMSFVFKQAAACLKDRGYLLSFIGDMYYGDEYHCLSYELASILAKINGLVWKANLIWYDVSKKLHLYGYQYAFIPSMIHQNILVFRKQLSSPT